MKFQIIVNICELCQLLFKIKYQQQQQQQVSAPSNPEYIISCTHILQRLIISMYIILMKPFMVSCGCGTQFATQLKAIFLAILSFFGYLMARRYILILSPPFNQSFSKKKGLEQITICYVVYVLFIIICTVVCKIVQTEYLRTYSPFKVNSKFSSFSTLDSTSIL